MITKTRKQKNKNFYEKLMKIYNKIVKYKVNKDNI